jgi:hypothetical protein
MPRLAERRQRQPQQVARLVAGLEAPATEEMAQRVDAVRHVMEHEHAHRAAPQEAGQTGIDRAADGDPEAEWRREAGEHPQHERAVDEAHDRILEQVRCVAGALAALGVDEQPAEMGMREAGERALEAAAVPDVGAVRIAILVGEGVMLAVVGDPGDDRALDRGRAEHGQDRPDRAGRLEAAVREMPVEADRHAETGGDVKDPEDDEIAGSQRLAPDLPTGEAEREERHDGDETEDDPVPSLVLGGLDICRARQVTWFAAQSGWTLTALGPLSPDSAS